MDQGEQAYLAVFRPASSPGGWPLGALADDEPFRRAVAKRGVLYPPLWDLDQPTVDALVGAARAVGDTGLFHLFVERLPGEEQRRQLGPPIVHYPFADTPLTVRRSGDLVTALVSEHGVWGVQFSDTTWAVVGGSTPFLEALNGSLAVPLEQQLHALLRGWAEERARHGTTRRQWAATFLAHLVGRDVAGQLLRAYDL